MSDEHQVVITADGELVAADDAALALERPVTPEEVGYPGGVRARREPVEQDEADKPAEVDDVQPPRPAEPVPPSGAAPPGAAASPPRSAELVTYEPPLDPAHMSLGDIGKVGRVFASSGMFKDTREGAQAVVKIMAAQELGLGPFAGMKGFDIIDGKPEMSAGLISALVKRSGKYDYAVQRCDDDGCDLDWYEDGEIVGQSSFTMADAKRAKLPRPNSGWEKYPSDMLFARAISRGARRYAPDVFIGSIYVTGELSDGG